MSWGLFFDPGTQTGAGCRWMVDIGGLGWFSWAKIPWVMVKCDVDRRRSSMIILAMGLSSCRPCGSWSQGVSAGAPTKVKATALIFSVLGFLYNLISGCMHNCNCCVSPWIHHHHPASQFTRYPAICCQAAPRTFLGIIASSSGTTQPALLAISIPAKNGWVCLKVGNSNQISIAVLMGKSW